MSFSSSFSVNINVLKEILSPVFFLFSFLFLVCKRSHSSVRPLSYFIYSNIKKIIVSHFPHKRNCCNLKFPFQLMSLKIQKRIFQTLQIFVSLFIFIQLNMLFSKYPFRNKHKISYLICFVCLTQSPPFQYFLKYFKENVQYFLREVWTSQITTNIYEVIYYSGLSTTLAIQNLEF